MDIFFLLFSETGSNIVQAIGLTSCSSSFRLVSVAITHIQLFDKEAVQIYTINDEMEMSDSWRKMHGR